jgi:hypothetical protein
VADGGSRQATPVGQRGGQGGRAGDRERGDEHPRPG